MKAKGHKKCKPDKRTIELVKNEVRATRGLLSKEEVSEIEEGLWDIVSGIDAVMYLLRHSPDKASAFDASIALEPHIERLKEFLEENLTRALTHEEAEKVLTDEGGAA